ncbi:MAG TPA: hypothetical protein VFZ09_48495 [Archangium sp.]|uniref:hypothetical protein n=1 Tax=Archangium sp. TaxID=1872627 RepID=UPI002E36CB38|nr:hypothetical protein [Archangium sp.]HEX5754117.1 hypothetical protein [Archangium sp.]
MRRAASSARGFFATRWSGSQRTTTSSQWSSKVTAVRSRAFILLNWSSNRTNRSSSGSAAGGAGSTGAAPRLESPNRQVSQRAAR